MEGRPALIVHGGAGGGPPELAPGQREGCLRAAAAGWQILEAGGGALDAVTAAVASLEEDPRFNAGVGSCLTEDGRVEMDASIMSGSDLAAGAVGAVTRVVHPVRLARAIMEQNRHVLVVGPGAEALARARGLPLAEPEYFVTPRQYARWMERSGSPAGTVGAVAVDTAGQLAAATSTGGLLGKLAGRVGDSAIIGAGTYADDEAGAASATGHGESILRMVLAKRAVDLLRGGLHPAVAARQAIDAISQRLGADAGLILVDRFGRIGHARNTQRMSVAYRTASRDLVAED